MQADHVEMTILGEVEEGSRKGKIQGFFASFRMTN